MKKIGLFLAMLLSLALPVLAADETAACGAIGLILVVYLVILLFILAIIVVVTVIIFKFIKKDAIARGDNPSKAWFALLGLLGLLIYVLTRPQGNVMPCPSCGKSRMQGLPRCPSCGNA